MRTTIITLSCALALALAAAGCGDSPVEPAGGGGGGGGPEFTDVPEIPRPTTVGGDVPSTSETLTRIERYTGEYNPAIDNAYGYWKIYRSLEIFPGHRDTETILEGHAWKSQIDDEMALLIIRENMSRLLLQNESGEMRPLTIAQRRAFGPYDVDVSFAGLAAEKPVYIRRDRHWELKELEGGAGNFLLVDENVTGTLSTSYTQGVSTTETETFGRSLTASGGLNLGALSAQVSGTLSRTFSSSVTVSKAKTQTFGKEVSGKAGKIIQFMVWELVESFTFCDENGAPYSDPNYIIPKTELVRRGAGVYLQATEFDA